MRFIILSFLFSATVFGQNLPAKDYFRSPLAIPLHASGTFGELRNNHFHSGLDFRTQQKEGLPVYAVADGYVSRIKVSSYGYGIVVYINHPNGYTSVYAHLQKFLPKIDNYVRAKQYEKQSFNIELTPTPAELPVTKNEIIALAGNSGSSGGPHLHFEYRETKSEMIINPLLFGLNTEMKDNIAPTISALRVYPVGDASAVNQSEKSILLNLSRLKDGTYLAGKIYAKGKLGFAINATDRSVGSTGSNGVYKVETFINGSPAFNYQFDKFAFDESRYLNNFIDYAHYYSTGQRFQKLFVDTPYSLSLIKHNTENGLVAMQTGNAINYRIEVSDFHGNKSIINGSIEYSDKPATIVQPKRITPYFVKAANDHNYAKNNVSVFIPANTFYEDFYMDFDVKDSVLYLHNPTVPVHSNVTITFDVSNLPKEVLKKTFIAGFNKNRVTYNSSYLEDNQLSAKVRVLGNFKLAQDTVAPKIFSPSFTAGKWLSDTNNFSLQISDNLSGIKTFDAYLNGKWILMHYEYKTRKITHNFSDGVVAEGRNDLKVIVTDNVGNSTTFETHFFRTQK